MGPRKNDAQSCRWIPLQGELRSQYLQTASDHYDKKKTHKVETKIKVAAARRVCVCAYVRGSV